MGKLNVKRLRKLCLAGVISTLDYWLYKQRNKRRRLKTSYTRRPFLLSNFTKDECMNFFRFSPFELRKLVRLLGIPATIKIGRSSYSGMEGFCIMLRRLSYPNRLCDIVKMFNRDETSLSRISNRLLRHIYETHRHRIETLESNWMTPATFDYFAERCSNAGSWLPNIVGFIDGTCRPICRPTKDQRQLYSGYKKQHLVKYQSVVYPNGIIGRLDGPFIGRRHDAAMLGLSNITNEFRTIFEKPGKRYAILGDTGYSNSTYIKVGYRNHRTLSSRQKLFNKEMSALRVSVEYGFGRVLQQFAFLDFKKNQKLYLQNLKIQYYVSALLANCQVCLRGGQVSEYFNCSPPSLESYLQ